MTRRKTVLLGTAVVAGVLAVAGAGAAAAAGGDEDSGPDRAISGAALEQASAAALAHTGQGRVTDTEVGDEEGFYEVEVTLEDGSETDVHLDEGFGVLGSEAEGTDG